MYFFMHEETVSRSAGLPHIAHLGEHRAFDGSLDPGVVKYDKRGIATELHYRLNNIVGGGTQQGPANLG